MASKYSDHIIKMKCGSCGRINYYTRKNRKSVQKKLELQKHCAWCMEHTTHKEAKK